MAKQKPGELNYATQGVGSAGHLSGQMLQNVARVKLAHVPYKGGADVIAALLGGDVRVGFAATTTAANIRSKIHVLAVTSRERDPSLPDVPSLHEAGLTGYDATFWFGMHAPAGTPAAIVKRLNALLNDVLKDPKIVEFTRRQGLNPVPSTPGAERIDEARPHGQPEHHADADHAPGEPPGRIRVRGLAGPGGGGA